MEQYECICEHNAGGVQLLSWSCVFALVGRHPIEAGLFRGVVGELTRQGLPLGFSTLPQRLREFGYKTHLVRFSRQLATVCSLLIPR